MKSFVCNLIVCALIGVCAAWAQQDPTVEWKTALQDLEQRLAGLPDTGGPETAAWRSEAESLRASIAAFAANTPGLKAQIPEALPERPSHQDLTGQLEQLNAAVNQVVQQTPGTL